MSAPRIERTEAESNLTRTMWQRGCSAEEISKALKTKLSITRTRSAVIGWCHRQKLTQGAKPQSQKSLKRETALARARETLRVKEAIKARKRAEKATFVRPQVDTSTPVISPNARDWRLERTMDECAYLVDGKHQACCNPVMGGNTTLSKRYCAGHYARMVDWGRFKPIGPKKQEFYAVANTFRERTDHAVEARRQEVGRWG